MALDSISFETLVNKLRDKSPASIAGPNLIIPQAPDPFVPQTASVESFPPGLDPLDSHVLLLTAPAAVGKTTFARMLASRSRTPLLDLSRVRVATHSLRGILSAEVGSDGPRRLQQGELCVIIDALDEGRLLSGEKNFEEFLNTTFTLLRASSPTGPRLALLGRPAAIELTSIVLELEAPDLTVTSLTIDYFDEAAASELVLAHATIVGGEDKITRFREPIRKTISAFFDAIGTAIDTPMGSIWDDPKGRAFAGYAPVLAALGALVGREENYSVLENRLRQSGIRDAWGVLQEVSQQVLVRESAKVQTPLRAAWGDAVPHEAYDETDQLELLTTLLTAKPIRISPRLVFKSAGASNAYREAVSTHLPEHPFLRGGSPVNDVLGSLVLAYALAQGSETTGGQAPVLLATYGRQPFLWRFFQRLVTDASLVSGDQLSYLLGSYWSDDSLGTAQARVGIVAGDEGTARLTYDSGDDGKAFRILPPIVLRGEVRNLSVALPSEELKITGWPGTDGPTAECVGDVLIQAGTLRFELERLQVGQLGRPSSSRLVADAVVGDHRLNVEVHENSTLMVGGVLAGRYPWDTVATTEMEPPSDDPVWNLLSDCAQRLPGALPVVVYEGFELTDDPRVEWARRHGDLFSRLLRTLVTHGYATTTNFPSKGDTPKMRIRPNQPWASLRAAYEDASGGDPRLRQVLRGI